MVRRSVRTAQSKLLIEANRAPEMYDLYHQYIDTWNQETNRSLMCLFDSVSSYGDSGSWGLMEYDGQPVSQAHKYRAVLDYL